MLHDGWVRFQNIFEGWMIAKKMCINGSHQERETVPVSFAVAGLYLNVLFFY
jgi:hypothetical protein